MTPKIKIQARRGIKEKDGDHPNKVRVIPRFKLDVEALMKLTSLENPPDIQVRVSRDKAIYIVGDAMLYYVRVLHTIPTYTIYLYPVRLPNIMIVKMVGFPKPSAIETGWTHPCNSPLLSF